LTRSAATCACYGATTSSRSARASASAAESIKTSWLLKKQLHDRPQRPRNLPPTGCVLPVGRTAAEAQPRCTRRRLGEDRLPLPGLRSARAAPRRQKHARREIEIAGQRATSFRQEYTQRSGNLSESRSSVEAEAIGARRVGAFLRLIEPAPGFRRTQPALRGARNGSAHWRATCPASSTTRTSTLFLGGSVAHAKLVPPTTSRSRESRRAGFLRSPAELERVRHGLSDTSSEMCARAPLRLGVPELGDATTGRSDNEMTVRGDPRHAFFGWEKPQRHASFRAARYVLTGSGSSMLRRARSDRFERERARR